MLIHSESLANLAPAFAAAQAEIENATKNASNPHFKSKYADLAEIIETSRPVLAKHGLAVIQIPGYRDGAVMLDVMLLHKSGEWIKGEAGSPLEKATAQSIGSATTYLRRYSLAALCGMAQEDDDGQAASQPRKQKAQTVQIATPDQIQQIAALVVQVDIPAEDAEKIGTRLENNSFTFDEAAQTLRFLAKKPLLQGAPA
jgi:hypothetical protein